MKYRNLCLINAVFDAHCDTCSVLKNSSFVTIPTEDEFLYCLEAILQTNLHSGKDTAALVKQEHFPVVTYRWMPACFTISAILICHRKCVIALIPLFYNNCYRGIAAGNQFPV